MKNVKMTVKPDNKTLVIELDLTQNFGTSASGKSETVASTSGNVDVPGFPGIKLGLNAYKAKS